MPNLNYHAIFLLLFFLGLFASSQIIVFSVSRELSSKMLTATAVALTNMVVIFSSISISIIGFLLNLAWQDYAINHIYIFTWNYQLALAVLPISLVIAVFLTFFLDDTNCKSTVRNSEAVSRLAP